MSPCTGVSSPSSGPWGVIQAVVRCGRAHQQGQGIGAGFVIGIEQQQAARNGVAAHVLNAGQGGQGLRPRAAPLAGARGEEARTRILPEAGVARPRSSWTM